MKELLVILFSYLMGTISGSFLLGKYYFKVDIRTQGSGNAGTTNAIRVFGLKFGLFTFLIDFIKGAVTVFLVGKVFGYHAQYVAFLGCVLGHDFPFYMHFKGGKGVATSMGASLVLSPIPSLLCMGLWVLGVAIYRVISLWSILFYLALPIGYFMLEKAWGLNLGIILVLSILGVYRHRENLQRILKGEEKKLGGGGK